MTDDVWGVIKEEVRLRIQAEPTLEPYLNLLVLSQDSLVSAIASIISSKLNSDALSSKDIKNFILDICKIKKNWVIGIEKNRIIKDLKNEIKKDKVICALSGGVDSSVVALLINKAIKKQVNYVFRKNY